jgi:hypothetical protein
VTITVRPVRLGRSCSVQRWWLAMGSVCWVRRNAARGARSCRFRVYWCLLYANGASGEATAPIAQSAERLHGKEKVYGSIPYWGSDGAGLIDLPTRAG